MRTCLTLLTERSIGGRKVTTCGGFCVYQITMYKKYKYNCDEHAEGCFCYKHTEALKSHINELINLLQQNYITCRISEYNQYLKQTRIDNVKKPIFLTKKYKNNIAKIIEAYYELRKDGPEWIKYLDKNNHWWEKKIVHALNPWALVIRSIPERYVNILPKQNEYDANWQQCPMCSGVGCISCLFKGGFKILEQK